MKIRSLLLVLVMGGTLPIVLLSSVMLVAFNRQTQQATEQGVIATVRAVSGAVDREVAGSIAVLEALTTVGQVDAGDLQRFDRAARTLLATRPDWTGISVYAPDGRHLVDIGRPERGPPSATVHVDLVRRVAGTRAPAVSDMPPDATGADRAVAVMVPVVRNDRVAYVLAAGLAPEALTKILLSQRVPDGTLCSLLDGRKVIIGRTRAADLFVGRPATPDVIAKIDGVPEIAFRTVSRDGAAVYAGFSRSPLTGWTAGIGVPADVLDAEFRSSLRLLLGVSTSATLLAMVVATLVGGRIARSVRALGRTARELVRGERVESRRVGLHEFDEVAETLSLAGAERQKIEERNRWLLDQTSSLAEIGRLLSQSLDFHYVSQQIVERLRVLLGALHAAVYQQDPESGDLIAVAIDGDGGPGFLPGHVTPRGTAAIGLAMKEARSVESANVLKDPRIAWTPEMRERVERAPHRAVLATPLVASSQIVGGISLGDREGRRFSSDEIRLVEAFAGHAAIALRNASLFQESEHRRRAAESLSAGGWLVSQSLDPEQVGQHAVDSLLGLLGARVAVLWRLDDATGDLVSIAVAGETGPRFERDVVLAKGTGAVGLAVARWETVVTADVLEDPRIRLDADMRTQVEQAKYRALLAIPLVIQGRVFGALAVGDRAGRVFTPEEGHLASAFAGQAAAALQNARLHTEIGQRLRHSENLRAVGQAVSGTLEGGEMMRRVAREACRALGADTAGSYLADADEATLRPAAGYHVPKHLLDDATTYAIPLKGHQIIEEAWQHQRAVAVSDVAADQRVDQTAFRRFAHRSSLFCPITVQGAPVGGLFVAWIERPHTFTGVEVLLIEEMCRQVGIALGNARLYESTQRAYEELSRAQAQLTQAQKMEAVGQLAGGVAHDFNNLLTVIIGRSMLALQRGRLEDAARRDVELICTAAERAASLTRQLLAFSRKQDLQPKPVDLNSLVSGVAPMLRRLIGEHVDLMVTLAGQPCNVMGDPGQIEQVVMNLVVNARDAIPEGGTISVETATRELVRPTAHGVGHIPAGAYVTLVVRDKGCGMDDRTLNRIFEPFFTTKDVGKGTGLGLATVHGIVHQSGGHIGVDSRVGDGTTVVIYLPRMSGSVAIAPGQDAPGMTRGTETVLLVEDDAEVRRFASEVLQVCGYDVIESLGPLEALVASEDFKGRIDLLVTDMVMPVMRGSALAEQLKQLRPEMAVLYMSGYTGEMPVGEAIVNQPVHFLQKPFRPGDLATAARAALEGAPAQS